MRSQSADAAVGASACGSGVGGETADRRHQRGEMGVDGRLTAQEITRKFGVGQVEQALETGHFSA